MTSKILVALDMSFDLPVKEIQLLDPYVAGFKVGLQLFCSQGPEVLMDLNGITGKPIFLDLKLLDIPTTIRKTIDQLREHPNLMWVSVHGIGGEDMLKAAHAAADQTFSIAVVSQLTSQEQQLDSVEKTLSDSNKIGIRSAIIPPWMLWRYREQYPDFTFMCPGIRVESENNDHKFAYTPKQAIDAGADFVIIGRPITQTKDWVEAVKKINDSIAEEKL